jgi:hypothetical protein
MKISTDPIQPAPLWNPNHSSSTPHDPLHCSRSLLDLDPHLVRVPVHARSPYLPSWPTAPPPAPTSPPADREEELIFRRPANHFGSGRSPVRDLQTSRCLDPSSPHLAIYARSTPSHHDVVLMGPAWGRPLLVGCLQEQFILPSRLLLMDSWFCYFLSYNCVFCLHV